MYENEKNELVKICKLLYDKSLVTACDGNLSVKMENGDILITPSGINKGFIEANQILVLNNKDEVIDGVGIPSKELPMHKNIYSERVDVHAVVHTHPVYATAFALAGINIPNDLLIESKLQLGKCELADYARPGSLELAEKVKLLASENSAILLKNHGAITYGDTLIEAFNKMEILESIAKTIIMSLHIGTPCTISKDELDKLKSK